MATSFTKLFSSITESTIWCESPETRCVWVTMLAMADRWGRVHGSVPGLANRSQVSIQATREALTKFLSPDPDSRTKDHEGRRIKEIDGGWLLLNHAKYRSLRDEEERRAYKTAKQREYRRKNVDVCVDNVDKNGHNADAEAYTDTEKNTDTEKEGTSQKPDCPREPEVKAESASAKPTAPQVLKLEPLELDMALPAVPVAEPKPKVKTARFSIPTVEEVRAHMESSGVPNPEGESVKFWNHFDSNGWKVGRNPMKSWKSAIITWRERMKERPAAYNGQLGSKHGAKSQRMYPGEKPPQIAPAEKI